MATYFQYMHEAMLRAEYEKLEDGTGVYAHIPGFEGLWATGETVEDARKELYDALDGWITVNNLVSNLPLPDIGISVGVEKASQE